MVNEACLTNIDIKKLIYELDKPHSELHLLAKLAIEQFNLGEYNNAELSLKQMDTNSVKFINLLKKLQKALGPIEQDKSKSYQLGTY